ncbi:MAG: hypothetical protein ACE5G9_11475 [Nitrospinales bacterium]
MNYLKVLILLSLTVVSLTAGCDKELKEHPMPASLKRQMEMQNDPEIQAKKVTGTIRLAPELADKMSKNSTLFILARPSGVESGPPMAVKRLRGVQFPYAYSIGQMDTMLEGVNFTGKVNITARLDQDGMAQAGPGDIEGKTSAQVGEADKNIVLDHLIPGEPGGGPGASRVVDKVIPALLAKAKGKTVSGTVTADKSVVKSIAPNSILFVILRKIGQTEGPPLAVQLYEKGALPLKFTVGQDDAVLPDTSVEGKVEVIARIDQDGNATSSPGDIEGSRYAVVGDQKVSIVLNRIVGQSASSPKDHAPGFVPPVGERIVSGVISVAPGLQEKIPDNAVLFIFARGQGVEQGPPLVVKLLKGVKFPFEFTLTQDDTMMPGDVFAGEVTVTARIDQDGNAAPSPGDLEGSVNTEVGKGGKVKIVLNNLLGG